MSFSTLLISKLDHFEEISEFWDRELKDHIRDPYYSSCMLSEHWKYLQHFGMNPLLVVFVLKERIVGVVPLMMKTQFGFRQIKNFDYELYPQFFNNHHDFCIDKLIDLLFKRLNCKSADIIFEDGSKEQKRFENVCNRKGLYFRKAPMLNSDLDNAIIPVNTSLEVFQESLRCSSRKKFRKTRKKLDNCGSWQIYNSKLDSISIKKIWQIEKYSWKNNLTGEYKDKKDLGLKHILQGILKNDRVRPFFKSEVWFLDLEGTPLAYQLVLKYNKRVVFLKTSYDSRYRKLGPGVFLMNYLVEHVFSEQIAEEIDFISNLPFTKVWKPIVKKRTSIKIERNPRLLKICRSVFENPICWKSIRFFTKLKWK